MQIGVFIPIGNNGWLISTTSPQYKPSFDLNRTIVEKAEAFGFDFALSMIKLHGFGGPSQFWDYNLESFTLMAGLAAVTSRIQLFATCAVLTVPPPFTARMAATIDSISHGRFGINIISGWQRREYAQMGIWPGSEHYHRRYDYCAEYVTIMKELWDTGRSDFKGDFFQMDDCRCLPMPTAKVPIICAGQSDAGTHFAVENADYNFCSSGGINEPTRVAPSVARLVAANEAAGKNCGALVLTMVIADETDEAAMAKWEHYKSRHGPRGAGVARLPGLRRPEPGPAFRTEQAADAGDAGTADAGRGVDRLLRLGGADAGRVGDGAGRAGRDADLRRFRHRHGTVRHTRPAADALPQRAETGGVDGAAIRRHRAGAIPWRRNHRNGATPGSAKPNAARWGRFRPRGPWSDFCFAFRDHWGGRQMCRGDDPDCAEFEKHRLDFRVGMAKERRAFLKSGFAATSGAAALATTGLSLVSPALAQTSAARRPGSPAYHHLPANARHGSLGLFQQVAETPNGGRIG